MNDYLVGWKIRWSPMLAPDQGMVPDASVFAWIEQSELAPVVGEEVGEGLVSDKEKKTEPLFAGDLWERGEVDEGETSLEPEWIEQVCCHIEAIVAGAGERA
ncbi:hypothetical protein [Thermogemmatispora onikobensis]|uniref:hypothetical protein n=1 Tax=Thermogemmatispora onikobensis TaxID=732234 RepID=UPI0008534F26|nr:hypothetical protein [Thermogemmatispora onikobensis]